MSFPDFAQILVDPFVRDLIRHKSNRLAKRHGGPAADRDDFAQELNMRLLAGWRRFDPQRAHYRSFVTVLLERAASQLRRHHTARKRQPLAALTGNNADPVDPRANHVERADLVIDLADALRPLPPGDRALAVRLRRWTVAETARHFGVPRNTLLRRLGRLRCAVEQAGLQDYCRKLRQNAGPPVSN